MKSGVIQGSVVSSQLFSIYINDLPSSVRYCNLLLFADDGKLVGKAKTINDCLLIQEDLSSIVQWSKDNELPLNSCKSQCLHIGHGNPQYNYTVARTNLINVNNCIDLGLTRTSDFSYSTHIELMVTKASRAAGMIFRAFSTRNEIFLMKLFVVYVRPILEYASVIWNPIYTRQIKDIEDVQRRFTKRLPGLKKLSYEDRLKNLNMSTLESRRNLADLAMVYKLLHDQLGITADSVGIILSQAPTRGKDINIQVHKALNNIVAKTFAYRASTTWNSLPPATKLSRSLPVFKQCLTKQLYIDLK